MRRGAKPAKAKAEAKPPVARKSLKSADSRVHDLEKRLAEAQKREAEAQKREAEALERQTATAEVLRVISSSPTSTQPVFDVIAANAMRVCEALGSGVLRVEGDMLQLAAVSAASPEWMEAARAMYPQPVGGRSIGSRVVLERRVIQVTDIEHHPEAGPGAVKLARAMGYRTVLMVPMLQAGQVVGVITAARKEPTPFPPRQVELLQTFADQAVLAVENVRLFNETKEALEQQTATSEILKVIASSPTDVQPVFDAIARHAVALCDGVGGMVVRYDGAVMRLAAFHNVSAKAWELHQTEYPRPPDRTVPLGAAIVDRTIVHVPNLQASTRFAGSPVHRSGRASMIAVPLLRHGEAIGAIGITRDEPEGFSDRDIALLQTFADQAVIAIENVRLFNETKEALEQQTATSEILKVISASPTDIQPVFDIIAANAARLCVARDAQVLRVEGDVLRLVSAYGSPSMPPVRAISRGHAVGRAVIDRQTIHVRDMAQAVAEFPETSSPQHGVESLLAVPLLREDVAVGVIRVSRTQIQPFTEQQIALLRTFADQAVIAIENVRLFTELQASNRDLTTALDTQTATSDILRVISRSPTDVQPVFDAIVVSAVRLLGAYTGALTRLAGDQIELAALTSTDAAGDAALRALFPRSLHSEGLAQAIIRDRAPLNFADAQTDPQVPEAARTSARIRGYRSQVVVPMLHHDKAVGTISVTRQEPGGFSDDEIALLKTFADQAVIAIENVRLFSELEGRNRDLTATAEILRVIGSSPTDVQPVFEAIADSAMHLFGAVGVAVVRYDGELISIAAARGGAPGSATVATERFGAPHRPIAGFPPEQTVVTKTMHHVADVDADPSCSEEFRHHARVRGFRSVLSMPMLRGSDPVGVIVVGRAQLGAFSTAEVELLRTFADQAVIAIENVRLFTELTEALEQETATAEILRAISGSPTDLRPVLETLVHAAARFCGAPNVSLVRLDGDVLRQVAATGPYAEDMARRVGSIEAVVVPVTRESVSGRAVIERRTIHIRDLAAEPESEFPVGRGLQRALGHRTMVATPLLREGVPSGAICLFRTEVAPFSDKQIKLLQTFADQAVIAIENVRLFTELQTSNRELTSALDTQTATSDILRVISRSQADVQPVFDAIVRSAVRLLGGHSGLLTRVVGDQRELGAFMSTNPAEAGVLSATYPRPVNSPGGHGQAIRDRAPVNILDMQMDLRNTEAGREDARVGGYRSMVVVPLLRQDEATGALGVTRREPGGFTDDEIALLQTFADQAVIAIENARLLTELRARTQELTRSVEQLTALGEVGRAVSSTLDLETVLTTIVSRAVQLSGLDGGVVFEYDEGAEEFVQRAMTDTGGALAEARRATRIRKGEGVLGRTAITLEPVQVADIATPGAYEGRLRDILLASGIRAILAVPMVREGHLIGCLGVTRNQPGEFPAETIDLLRTFATQSALAIQNARLFREIEQKSRELEAASRHKSEFLANMSHELRTPLNAIIGFSEVLTERMFGELNEKQEEYLRDIYASGQHLLSLINDILDLSKIEAGRMELEATDFDLPSAIDNALILVRERATRRGITLGHSVDERLGSIRGDERKVKQVLLNLLSNALKFTPEGGRIDVSARVHDEVAEVSVTDTGVGIAPEDQEAVFEEFRQVGTADKKVEGTGLGLALSRKFIELHGGRIWVKSQLGAGSTFTFTLPMRRED